MKSIDEIERLLAQTPTPSLVEGPHREQLKERLLMEPLPTLQKEKKTRMSLFARMSPALKVAATILAAALLVGAGWAAEKIYEKLKFTEASLVLEKYPEQEWTLPSGKKLTTSAMTVTVVNPDDPKAVETAQRQHKEMKELIGQKKYKFLRQFKNEFTGETQYVYRFTLSDGTEHNMNFLLPLENVTSWDDYRRKEQQQMQHYREQVNNAIAAGKYRLIDQDVMLVHICMDKGSHKKIRVQRISLRDGDELALYRPYDIAPEEQAATQPQSSWQDHLQAIREGKLELLDAETVFNHTYEMNCEDGTKRIFWNAGDDPLKRSNAK